jgi:hypothetical protein
LETINGKSDVSRDHPKYAGEVDHAELIRRLSAGFPDGWALSTSAEALQGDSGVVSAWGARGLLASAGAPHPFAASAVGVGAVIVYGGRELTASESQTVTDALE